MDIVILTLVKESACSFYRSVGVFQQLRNLDPSIRVRTVEAAHWSTLGACDLVVMERPTNENFLKAIQDCKAMGIPVWSDFDDDLFNLEPDNPGYSYHSQKKTKLTMQYCIKHSDIVTVSTPEIADVFKEINKNVVVIPNAFNDYIYKMDLQKNEEAKISWRGSITHRGDLLEYVHVMWKLAKKHPAIEWNFYGKDLWFVTENTPITEGLENSFVHGEMDMLNYMYEFRSKRPSVHLIPLKDNHFNRCKSNCAWIEATWAGAACVVPTFPEFQRVMKDTYSGKIAFGAIAENLILDKPYRNEVYHASKEYIEQNLKLSEINKTRLQIAKEISRGNR